MTRLEKFHWKWQSIIILIYHQQSKLFLLHWPVRQCAWEIGPKSYSVKVEFDPRKEISSHAQVIVRTLCNFRRGAGCLFSVVVLVCFHSIATQDSSMFLFSFIILLIAISDLIDVLFLFFCFLHFLLCFLSMRYIYLRVDWQLNEPGKIQFANGLNYF